MKILILFAAVLLSVSCGSIPSNKGKTYNLVVGTYTNKEKSNGIHVYSFNTETGRSSFRSKTLGIKNPSYLTISKDRKNIYSVSEVENGTIQAFSFNAQTVSVQAVMALATYQLMIKKNWYLQPIMIREA